MIVWLLKSPSKGSLGRLERKFFIPSDFYLLLIKNLKNEISKLKHKLQEKNKNINNSDGKNHNSRINTENISLEIKNDTEKEILKKQIKEKENMLNTKNEEITFLKKNEKKYKERKRVKIIKISYSL